jgi:hypothetical protein
MGPSLGRRIAALFRSEHQGIELVFTANGWAALAIGGVLWLGLDVSLSLAIPSVPSTFVLLGVLLLYRGTFWISAVLGSTVMAASSALLAAAIGHAVHPVVGGWTGGVVGFAAGTAFSLWCYVKVSRIARGVSSGS